MELIIEVLARNGRVRERIKLERDQVSIGRSFRNDVILSDHYVCPQHLVLRFDSVQQHWMVADVSIQNGTYHVGRGRMQQPQILASGDAFDLGETRLRILLPEHEIPPTRVMPTGRLLADYIAMPIVALALLVITLGVFAFARYLGQGTEIKLQELLLEALMFLALPFTWACLWGLIGRVAVHDTRFSLHLSMGSLLVMLLFIIAVINDFISFGFSNDAVAVWLENGAEGIALCLFLGAGIAMATSMRRRSRWLLANTLAWGIVGVGVLSQIVRSDPYEAQLQQAYNLKPPFAQMQKSVSVEHFMTQFDGLFSELDDVKP